ISKKLCGGRLISMVATMLPPRSTPMSLNGPMCIKRGSDPFPPTLRSILQRRRKGSDPRPRVRAYEDTVRIATISADRRAGAKSETRIGGRRRRKGLHRAGLQAERAIAPRARRIDGMGEQGEPHTTPAMLNRRVHGLDLAMRRIKLLQGRATEQAGVIPRHPEGAVGRPQGIEVQNMRALGRRRGSAEADVGRQQL